MALERHGLNRVRVKTRLVREAGLVRDHLALEGTDALLRDVPAPDHGRVPSSL